MRCPGALLFLATVFGGCYRTTSVGSDDAASTATDPVALPDGAVPTTFCGGIPCFGDQECCFTTGVCVAPGDLAACPQPTTGPWGGTPCASNSQCSAGQYCIQGANSPTGCTGPGTCTDRTNCGSGDNTPRCGCDGRTYANSIAACNAGVRIVGWSDWETPNACGTPTPTTPDNTFDATIEYPPTNSRIACVLDSQCPSDQRCCSILNVCFDPSRPELCAMPPPGTNFPCDTNADCDSRFDMCLGGPACDAPGFCGPRPESGPCTGVLSPVCGCDGMTYTNACEAANARQRIAFDGGCSPDS